MRLFRRRQQALPQGILDLYDSLVDDNPSDPDDLTDYMRERRSDPEFVVAYIRATVEHEAVEREDRVFLEDILGSVSLYINWRSVTKQLTTEQKERFYEAVQSWSRRLDDGIDDTEPYGGVEPWWRDDYMESEH